MKKSLSVLSLLLLALAGLSHTSTPAGTNTSAATPFPKAIKEAAIPAPTIVPTTVPVSVSAPAPMPSPSPSAFSVQPVMATATPSQTSSDGYYTNSDGNQVHVPVYADTPPAGATAQCRDGSYSFSQHHSGTCSGHGGVSIWLR